MQSKPLTNAELAEFAAQVERSERPQSELQKYGTRIGEAREMSVDDFMKQVAAEEAATRPTGK